MSIPLFVSRLKPWQVALVIHVVVLLSAGFALAAISFPADVSEFTQFIRDVGFPIFVAAYVLIRLERTMGKMIDAIEALTRKLDARD